MLNPKAILAGAALIAAGFASPALETPAPVGPGGVLDTVKKVLAAMDSGDLGFLETAFADDATGLQFVTRADGSFEQLEGRGSLEVFFDVTPDGKRTGAKTSEEFLARVAGSIASGEKAGRRLETRIRSIEANCPAAEASYAVVDFERAYSIDGKRKVVPMRATALLRYTGGSPSFQVYHWHASAASAGAKVAKKK